MPDAESPASDRPILTWQAPLHPTFERSTRWYAIAGTLAMAVAVIALLRGDWSLTLVTVLCAGLYFLVRNHRFPNVDVKITEKGVGAGEEFMAWTAAEGYWFVQAADYAELHIVPKARGRELKVLTGDVHLATIREAIGSNIPELKDKTERFIDAFIRICKL